MKKIIICFSSIFLSSFCFAQSDKKDIVKVKKDSLEYALKSGALAFLNDTNLVGWTQEVYINNKYIGDIYVKNDTASRKEILNSPKGKVYEWKQLKVKRPNKTFHYIPYREIIIE